MSKQVIFDCDNTMGVKGCDVDDGLALLYLLGKKDIEITGITTTYGNSDINTVYKNTHQMLREVGRTDIQLYKGCPDCFTPYSDAVDFLIKSVNSYKGMISILATGSLTNLFAAYCRDNSFFEKVAEIVIMGGITEPLIINGKQLDELNISCDPTAAKWLLKKGHNISIVTGNACLSSFVSKQDFYGRLDKCNSPIARYISKKCTYWFEEMMNQFSMDGFYNWDVVAAAYLCEPDLFQDDKKPIIHDLDKLESGLLIKNNSMEKSNHFTNIPQICEPDKLMNDIYLSWLNAKVQI